MEPKVQASDGSVASGRDTSIHIDRSQWLLSMVLAAADPSPPPRPDSPHLSDCPHCGRKWLSRLALFCPLCGFSVQAHRIASRRRRDARDLCNLMAVFCWGPLAIFALLATLGYEVAKSSWAAGGFYAIVAVIAMVAAAALKERDAPAMGVTNSASRSTNTGETK